jgi:predicted ATPase
VYNQCGLDACDAPQTICNKVTSKLHTLDEELMPALPAVLALLDIPVDDPLPPTRAAELLHELLGEHPALAPLLQRLIARMEGNPFFLEESVRTLMEIGVLVGERGAY